MRRRRPAPRSERCRGLRLGLGLCLASVLGLGPGAGSAPAAADLDPAPSLRLTDRYGNGLRSFLSPQQTVSAPVPLAQVSPWMVLATLAAEDKRFWDHHGVDAAALGRALGQDLAARRVVSGASTLTQQLARALEPRPRTLWGKVKEALGALRLERGHSKAEILEAYLNRGSYGGELQGVEAASQGYFGVPASSLSLAQAALLAGVPKGPARYDPLRHRSAARRRQAFILDRLAAEGWVDPASLALARAERLVVRAPRPEFAAPHFCEAVRRWHGPAGGELRTTLDGPLQRDLEALLRAHLRRLEGEHVGEAALVVLDNRTGEVLAWVGSRDYFNGDSGQVDGVLALRQPGSSTKPFLYALAFSRGYHPASLVDDEPYTNAGGFSPRNYDLGFHGRVSLRQALACSYNVPAVKVIEDLGVDQAYRNSRRFGLRSLDKGADHYGPGLALGDGEVTLLELATAYAALGRLGLWRPARLTLGPDPVEWPRAPRQRALDADSCFQALDVLRDDAPRQPAFGSDSMLRLPFGAAVKTGTTKDYRDNWCVGVTPNWTVAVWAGNPEGEPMRRVSGVSGAGPLFHDAAMRVAQDRPPGEFEAPPGLRRVTLDLATGRPPLRPGCATVEDWVQERFLARLDGAGPFLLDPRSGGSRQRIDFPRDRQVFVLDPHAAPGEQAFLPRAAGLAPGEAAWVLDGTQLDARAPWIALAPGEHQLLLQAPGRPEALDQVRFRVLE